MHSSHYQDTIVVSLMALEEHLPARRPECSARPKQTKVTVNNSASRKYLFLEFVVTKPYSIFRATHAPLSVQFDAKERKFTKVLSILLSSFMDNSENDSHELKYGRDLINVNIKFNFIFTTMIHIT